MAGQDIHPVLSSDAQEAAHLTIAAHYKATDGSEWLREGDGYKQVVAPWAVEEHIPPITRAETFGDVASLVAYVEKYGNKATSLVCWSDKGIRAILDYPQADGTPGRLRWTADLPFVRTRQWEAWAKLANGRALSQRELIEALEDRGEDIKEPASGELLKMLVTLRGNVNAQADATQDENGKTSLQFTRTTSTTLKLPQIIKIGIPVLRGHTVADEAGVEGPVRYEIDVRIRVTVVDGGKIEFRLSWPNAETSLEDAVQNRIDAAKAALGDAYTLLRSA